MTEHSPDKFFDFTGRVVLVTGGSGGIGEGIVRRFVQTGAQVALNYRSSQTAAEKIAEELAAAGGEVIVIQADVTDEGEVERLVSETVSRFGRLDLLVNNAGAYPERMLAEMSASEWDAVLAANLRSVFLCTQAAARQMTVQEGGGAIINIATVEAIQPAPGYSHYNASKAGVLMFTRSAANEYGRQGIRVNAVSPGLIWRPGIEESWPEGVRHYRQSAPLGRLGQPDDIADACLFLASPASRWISGINLIVDGGVLTNMSF
jgi:NAD(P)-dependent dehydrogenase (short-subunit alcohol dehydrogenase family)